MKSITTGVFVALSVVAPAAHAQWAQVPDRSIPRTSAGEPDLTAPTPRAADGRPDLSGVWMPDAEPVTDFVLIEGDTPLPRHFINIAAALKPEEVPIQPWAQELLDQRLASEGVDDPLAHCKPTGLPMLNSVPLPYKVVQTPQMVLVLYEENSVFRQIFLDDRKPVEDAVPRWMGYSTGRWDGDALVVTTVGFHDRHWLDGMGHPNSDQLRLTERWRRRDAGHLEIETTVDDPGAYTKPITFTVKATAIPADDLLEYFCTENEKDIQHYQKTAE
jgi:hypothetical protein